MNLLKSTLFVIPLLLVFNVFSQFNKDSILKGNKTPTYIELIEFYKYYADENENIALYNMGQSDDGLPIYLCVLNAEKDSIETFKKATNNTTMLINNGIHPGEPSGINACMQLVIDYAINDKNQQGNASVVGIIPSYNVGGTMNRSAFSRANQNGPDEYGFRGNAQNLDLNRDFIKMDSKNMWIFATIYHALDPDIFIDTHTSNGADYQYTLTYILPLYDRLPKSLRNIIFDNMLPELSKNMQKNWRYELFPYVSMNDKTLDKGIHAFNATPRYAMGYAELFNSISFTTEAHMLKPFEERVKSTYGFIIECINWMDKHADEVENARKEAFKQQLFQENIYYNFEPKTVSDSILMKTYEWNYIESELTAQQRLYYNQNKPKELIIPFDFRHIPKDSLKTPTYYVVKKQASDVIERLRSNKIDFSIISKDSLIKVSKYKVIDYVSTKTPYEGHFLHSNVKIEKHKETTLLQRGDIIIPTFQRHRNFIVSVLEPQMEDSYFNWNFFDSYLQQKEYFSPYIFEEKAIELLKDNPDLEKKYRKKQAEDTDFASNRWQQLYFIYKHSPYYESTHAILPVYAIE